jgi:hypothetical protein
MVEKTPIRIPVKLVDGQWEFFYGGSLPVCDGAVGELILDKRSIEDKEFLARLNRKSEYKILESGTQLRVALTVRPFPEIPTNLKKQLITMNAHELGDYTLQHASFDTQFAQITIGNPTTRQEKICPNETGGVWLQLQGTQPKSITTSSVIVPGEISREPLDSLNHAFTRLSEVCEPWRKSHTGNIYDRVLYQEKNGRWYSLSTLRDAAIATDEHQLIKEQWALIMQNMTSFRPNLNSK